MGTCKSSLATPQKIAQNNYAIDSHFLIPKFPFVLINVVQSYFVDCCLDCFRAETIFRKYKPFTRFSLDVNFDLSIRGDHPFVLAVQHSFDQVQVPQKIKTTAYFDMLSTGGIFVGLSYTANENDNCLEMNTVYPDMESFASIHNAMAHRYVHSQDSFYYSRPNKSWVLDEVLRIMFLDLSLLKIK